MAKIKIGQKVAGKDQFGNDFVGLVIGADEKAGTLTVVDPNVATSEVQAEDCQPLKNQD